MERLRLVLLAIAFLLAAAPARAGAPETPGFFDRALDRFSLLHDLADAAADETLEVEHGARPPVLPVAGDWDGDGRTDLGVFDPRRHAFELLLGRVDGVPDLRIPVATWRPWLLPVTGDWNGDGRDDLGVFDRYGRRFSLLAADGAVTRVMQLSGRRSCFLLPFAGDFDGDGTDELGVYDPHDRTVHLLRAKANGGRDLVLRVSERSRDLRPLPIDLDGDGRDDLGLYDRKAGRIAVLADLADGVPDGSLDVSGVEGRLLLPVAGVFAAAPEPPADDDPVPDTAGCQPVANQDPGWTHFERDVLVLVNAARAAGGTCGDEGAFDPAPPLEAHPSLRCSARLHARDLAARDVVTQFGVNGSLPETRAAAAGYPVLFVGEAVSGGLPEPAAVVAGWFANDLTCAMLREPVFRDAAAGHAEGPSGRRFYSVLDLGASAP